jgi:hypothetical protein
MDDEKAIRVQEAKVNRRRLVRGDFWRTTALYTGWS